MFYKTHEGTWLSSFVAECHSTSANGSRVLLKTSDSKQRAVMRGKEISPYTYV
jgi:hypothetical protein